MRIDAVAQNLKRRILDFIVELWQLPVARQLTVPLRNCTAQL